MDVLKLFNVPRESFGLSDFLSGAKDKEDVIIKTSISNLDFIPAGSLSQAPTDLLSKGKLKSFIQILKSEYDQIIIDSPPVNVGVPDPLLLSRVVDGTVIVTRCGKTHKKDFNEALQRLSTVSGGFRGAVINFFSPSK
jgi:capsular exopolysaccharide synthesis family protein